MKKKILVFQFVLLFAGLFFVKTPVFANTIETAKSASTGQTITDSLIDDQSNNVNYYKISLSTAGCLSLKVTSYLERTGFRIYDSNYNSIKYSTIYWDSASKVGVGTLSYELQNGTYYIRVIGNYGDSSSSRFFGKYSFTLDFNSAGVNHTESNNDFGAAVNIGLNSTVKGHIALNNEVDYYKIKLSSAGRLSLKITSYLDRLGFRIYDSNYNSIKYDTLHWDSASKVGVGTYNYDLQADTYYIRVIGNYGNSSSCYYFGKYSFVPSFSSAEVNHIEPNNSFATACKLDLGKTVKGHIALNNEVDYYKISIPQTCTINIKVLSYISKIGYRIYDSSYKSIEGYTVNLNNNASSKTEATLFNFKKGTYYIRIIGSYWYGGGSSYFGKYSMTISQSFKKPSKCEITSLYNKSKKKIFCQWREIFVAKGYEVTYATNKKFKNKKIKTVKSNQCTLNKLKKGKTYYVKVRGYNLNSSGKKIYGNYSSVRIVKIYN